MVAKCRITVAANIDPSYSPGDPFHCGDRLWPEWEESKRSGNRRGPKINRNSSRVGSIRGKMRCSESRAVSGGCRNKRWADISQLTCSAALHGEIFVPPHSPFFAIYRSTSSSPISFSPPFIAVSPIFPCSYPLFSIPTFRVNPVGFKRAHFWCI